MQITDFSNKYNVKKLTPQDVECVFNLCASNPLYYEYCPPFVTRESILEDMEALPPNVKNEDKYFVGFYDEDKLIAVLDLILGYPEKEIAFIGFFMTDSDCQKKGIGSAIIQKLLRVLGNNNFKKVRLAWVKGNPQAEYFWTKNGFVAWKETESLGDEYKVMLADARIGNS